MDFQCHFKIDSPNQRKQPLVLAVDDNQDNLQLITQLLELSQCEFITAADGATAILKAKNHQPDLILLDMMLPDITGIEVTRKLKQHPQTQKIPIIAVTAMARVEDRENFVAAGCITCIIKPFDVEDLEAVIRRYAFY